jgi:hypothetical protein
MTRPVLVLFAQQQDVGRFHVAVQDAGGVGGTERADELPADRRHLCGGQRAVRVDDLLQRAGPDELHDDPGPAVLFDDVVHGHDAGMVQPCGGPRLPLGALVEYRAVFVAQPAVDQDLFDRHVPVQHLVPGAPDGAHATLADMRQQPVTTGQHPPRTFRTL